MGRTKPSKGLAPSSQRKEARAKHARQVVNKIIPALLNSNPRARRGVDAAELIVAPPANATSDTPPKSNNPNGGVQLQHTKPFTLRLLVTDSLTAAASLRPQASNPGTNIRTSKSSRKNPAILNLASPLRPGGGVLTGSTAQEEFLCLRTTLYPSLRDEYYRLPELGVVWTPDVMVWVGADGTELGKGDRWWVDVVTAGMLRFPDVEYDVVQGHEVDKRSHRRNEDEDEDEDEDGDDEATGGCVSGRYSNSADREMAEAKMTAVLRVLSAKGARRIVLGAWGCGAYGNPVEEIARAWRRVLLGETAQNGRKRLNSKSHAAVETWEGLEEVVFAISQRKMAEDFAKAFGNNLQIEETEQGSNGEGEDGGKGEQENNELQAKIQEMEEQIRKVLNPDLRDRMNSILEGLRKQLEGRIESRQQ